VGNYARACRLWPDFKKEIKRRYPAWVEVHPFGEVLPRRDNYVTVEGTPMINMSAASKDSLLNRRERAPNANEMYETVEMLLHEAKAEISSSSGGELPQRLCHP